jgi:hypothetical protein
MIKDVIAEYVVNPKTMFEVRTGVLRALSTVQAPADYLIGNWNLSEESLTPLRASTQLVRRHRPRIFSESDVFSGKVDFLASYGELDPLKLGEYRKVLITQGQIDSVFFLPDFILDPEFDELIDTVSSSGKIPFILRGQVNQDGQEIAPHGWLRPFN